MELKGLKGNEMNISLFFEPLLELVAVAIIPIVLVSLISIIKTLFKDIKNVSVENELLELQFDNSEYANNRRLELFKQKSIDDMAKEINNVFETAKDVSGEIGNQQMYHYNRQQNKNSKESRCQYCGTKHDNTEKSCSACGAQL